MTRLRLTLIGGVAAVLLCAGAAFANPGTANLSSPGQSTDFLTTSGARYVNARLTSSQLSTYARVTVSVLSRNTSLYSGTAQIRCNGSSQIFVDTFGGSDTSGTRTSPGTGNAWAGTITIN